MTLGSIDRCEVVDMKPWERRKDIMLDSLFVGCEIFEERVREYLRWDWKRRLRKENAFAVDSCNVECRAMAPSPHAMILSFLSLA